ncbi:MULTISPECIES: GNAT family N-acetyltransferase [unclassified Lysinibacillus]|uniref:GNAT family N-acetyltransferase n=1 Tax=unclassified Lysinibacillus TaxID=2636778 RepID=UPI00190198E1|nr:MULTISPECIES: GNAT family N-acetyltransferase [unclassified Lysinibacillus]
MVNVRIANVADAEQIVEVMKNAEESGFMMFSPGERQISAGGFRKYIENLKQNPKSQIFVACNNEQILGYIMVVNEQPERISHRAYIVIGVHSDSRGKGVGKALFTAVTQWAKEMDLHRLELTVMVKNEDAVHLYKKMGFEIEGTKKDSLFVDGQFEDEYYMAKIL